MSATPYAATELVGDLKAARAELVARGRCRGRMRIGDHVCLVGAIAMVTVPGADAMDQLDLQRHGYDPRPMRARLALEQHIPDREIAILWNDHPDTTDQDVLDLFDKALAELGGLT